MVEVHTFSFKVIDKTHTKVYRSKVFLSRDLGQILLECRPSKHRTPFHR